MTGPLPAYGAVFKGVDRIGKSRIPQGLGSDDRASPSRTVDDDRGRRRGREIRDVTNQFAVGTAERPWDGEVAVLAEGTAIENDDVIAGSDPAMDLGGSQRRSGARAFDAFAERLGWNVGAFEDLATGRPPGLDPALVDRDVAVTHGLQHDRGALRQAVTAIRQRN